MLAPISVPDALGRFCQHTLAQGQAEVDELDFKRGGRSLGADQQVARLDVAVQHLLGMGGLQRLGDATGQRQKALQR